MTLGSYGYGTNGSTKKAMNALTARQWSNDEIAHFLNLPLNHVIEAGKDYIDLIGFSCARVETLVFFIDMMHDAGFETPEIKDLLLTQYSSPEINKIFNQTLLVINDAKASAAYLAEEFGRVLKRPLLPV